jgi:hypothetical protein
VILGERLVDSRRQQDFLDLALDRQLVRQQHVLGDLLCDGRGADRSPGTVPAADIRHRRAQHRHRVDAVMAVEILVLGGEKGSDHPFRDDPDGHENTSLGGIFGEQPAVAGEYARRNRRLVIGELLVIREVAAEIPNRQPRHRAADHRQQDRADKNETDDSGQGTQTTRTPLAPLCRCGSRPDFFSGSPASGQSPPLCAKIWAFPRPIWLSAGRDRQPTAPKWSVCRPLSAPVGRKHCG